MNNCKNNKNKIDKRLKKIEDIIVIMSTADIWLTISNENTQILDFVNKTQYKTNAPIDDILTFYNLIFMTNELPKDVITDLEDICYKLSKFLALLNSPSILDYNTYIPLVQKIQIFIKKYTYTQFTSFSRILIKQAKISLFITPLIELLEFYYNPELILYTSTQKVNSGIILGINRLHNAICFSATLDNMTDYTLSIAYTDLLTEYFKLKYHKLTFDEIFDNHIKDLICYMQHYRNNCSLNKFLNSNNAKITQEYIFAAYKAELMTTKLRHLIVNMLLDIPTNVFTTRKYIYKDCCIQDTCTYELFQSQLHPTGLTINNICIKETTYNAEKVYPIIEVSYEYNNCHRVFPIIIDNLHMLLFSYSLIDLAVLMEVMCCYDIFEIPYSYSDVKHIFNEYLEDNLSSNIDKRYTPKKNYNRLQHKEIYIAAYVRKLPIGQKVSENAIALAQKYTLQLSEGYTLVSDYTRKY